MAHSFNKSKGGAQKSQIDSYTFTFGTNTVRIVGDILARYVYWIRGENNKNIPFECLSFDRDQEKFTNEEKDWIPEFYPDLTCSWGYVTQCIEKTEDGYKITVVNLKKKLWEQILVAAKDLGDPTDVKTGWDIVFERTKTGPQVYNVEYQLRALACKTRALNEEELEVLKGLKSMDLVIARPTPEAQKTLLDRITGKEKENVDEKAVDEFDMS